MYGCMCVYCMVGVFYRLYLILSKLCALYSAVPVTQFKLSVYLVFSCRVGVARRVVSWGIVLRCVLSCRLLSICLSIRLSVSLSVYQSTCQSVYQSIYLSVCLPACLPACLPVCLSVPPSIHPSRQPSIHPSFLCAGNSLYFVYLCVNL